MLTQFPSVCREKEVYSVIVELSFGLEVAIDHLSNVCGSVCERQ